MEKRTIIQRRSLADEVAEQVQKQIIDGELKEGDKLPDRSRTHEAKFGGDVLSIREAVKKLRTWGI